MWTTIKIPSQKFSFNSWRIKDYFTWMEFLKSFSFTSEISLCCCPVCCCLSESQDVWFIVFPRKWLTARWFSTVVVDILTATTCFAFYRTLLVPKLEIWDLKMFSGIKFKCTRVLKKRSPLFSSFIQLFFVCLQKKCFGKKNLVTFFSSYLVFFSRVCRKNSKFLILTDKTLL